MLANSRKFSQYWLQYRFDAHGSYWEKWGFQPHDTFCSLPNYTPKLLRLLIDKLCFYVIAESLIKLVSVLSAVCTRSMMSLASGASMSSATNSSSVTAVGVFVSEHTENYLAIKSPKIFCAATEITVPGPKTPFTPASYRN